jgi:hypothetical protein
MPQHIKIITDFDITNTGVVRNFKKELLPFKAGSTFLVTKDEWVTARRQQSNWETLIQIISLRTQPLNIHTVKRDKKWVLEFDIETIDAYKVGDDALGLLKEDCGNVPFLVGLTEQAADNAFIIADGPDMNTEFLTDEF